MLSLGNQIDIQLIDQAIANSANMFHLRSKDIITRELGYLLGTLDVKKQMDIFQQNKVQS